MRELLVNNKLEKYIRNLLMIKLRHYLCMWLERLRKEQETAVGMAGIRKRV
jgi:hypothetical protein